MPGPTRLGGVVLCVVALCGVARARGAALRAAEPRYPATWQGDEETAFEAHVCSWSYIDACSEEMQRWMMNSLVTDASRLFPAMKQNALALLDPQAGERVLDVGCGIGDDLRAIANVVGPKGRVVGVDASDAMLNFARQRARRDGSRNIEFAKGSAYKLSDVPGFGQFDAARIERTMQHLQRPTEALAEMIRAVRPGGRVMAVEVDWGTIAVDHPDHSLTQHILDATQGLVAQPWAGRELRNWFKRAGLRHVRVRPVAVATTSLEAARFDQQVKTIATDGFLERDVVEQWLDELREMADEGQFLYSITAYLAVGVKRGRKHARRGGGAGLPGGLDPPAQAPPMRSHARVEESFETDGDAEVGSSEDSAGREGGDRKGGGGGASSDDDDDGGDGGGDTAHGSEVGAGSDATEGKSEGASERESESGGEGAEAVADDGSEGGDGERERAARDEGGSGSLVGGASSGTGSDEAGDAAGAQSGVAVADEPAPAGDGSGSSAPPPGPDDTALGRIPQPGTSGHVAHAGDEELEWSEEDEPPPGAAANAGGGLSAEPVDHASNGIPGDSGSGGGSGSDGSGSGEGAEVRELDLKQAEAAFEAMSAT